MSALSNIKEQEKLLQQALQQNQDIQEVPIANFVTKDGNILDFLSVRDQMIDNYTKIMTDLFIHCADLAKEKEAFYVS